MKAPTKPLSDKQRRHLGELWVRNEDELRAIIRRLGMSRSADELLSDLAIALVRSQFVRLPADCTDQDFLNLSAVILRMARLVKFHKTRRWKAGIESWFRLTNPALFNGPPSVEVERADTAAVVVSFVLQLPPEQQDVVESHYLRGESQVEIGRRWGTTKQKPNRTVKQALEALREVVPDSLDPGGMTHEQTTERMQQLRANGVPLGEIAKRFGLKDRKTVKSRLKLAGKWQQAESEVAW